MAVAARGMWGVHDLIADAAPPPLTHPWRLAMKALGRLGQTAEV